MLPRLTLKAVQNLGCNSFLKLAVKKLIPANGVDEVKNKKPENCYNTF